MILRDRYWFVWGTLLCSMAWAADDELPKKPPGRYFELSAQTHAHAETFKSDQPIVGTSYFYWYDIDSRSHIIDHDGTDALTTHPADMNGISYKRASWHKQQLTDMIDAGVDFLMPVFWGIPARYDGWSFTGLGPLVQAHSELQAEGAKPPMIGLFYDSSNPKVGLFEGAFRPVGDIKIGNSGEWKTTTFNLKECLFMNRCNGVDFRLAILGGELTVSKVRLEMSLLH